MPWGEIAGTALLWLWVIGTGWAIAHVNDDDPHR